MNVLENILGIEMGMLVVDNPSPTNHIMIKTKRSTYCFKLSNEVPVGTQYEIFRNFIIDVNTPIEQPKESPVTMDSNPVQEKHDGARLFDEPTSKPADVEITTKQVATQD